MARQVLDRRRGLGEGRGAEDRVQSEQEIGIKRGEPRAQQLRSLRCRGTMLVEDLPAEKPRQLLRDLRHRPPSGPGQMVHTLGARLERGLQGGARHLRHIARVNEGDQPLAGGPAPGAGCHLGPCPVHDVDKRRRPQDGVPKGLRGQMGLDRHVPRERGAGS